MLDKIFAAIASIALLGIVVTLCYHEFSKDEVKIVVELKQGEDPFVAMRHIVPADSTIREVHEIDKHHNEYEIIVETRRKRQMLLEWFLKNHRVQRAELKN